MQSSFLFLLLISASYQRTNYEGNADWSGLRDDIAMGGDKPLIIYAGDRAWELNSLFLYYFPGYDGHVPVSQYNFVHIPSREFIHNNLLYDVDVRSSITIFYDVVGVDLLGEIQGTLRCGIRKCHDPIEI